MGTLDQCPGPSKFKDSQILQEEKIQHKREFLNAFWYFKMQDLRASGVSPPESH